MANTTSQKNLVRGDDSAKIAADSSGLASCRWEREPAHARRAATQVAPHNSTVNHRTPAPTTKRTDAAPLVRIGPRGYERTITEDDVRGLRMIGTTTDRSPDDVAARQRRSLRALAGSMLADVLAELTHKGSKQDRAAAQLLAQHVDT